MVACGRDFDSVFTEADLAECQGEVFAMHHDFHFVVEQEFYVLRREAVEVDEYYDLGESVTVGTYVGGAAEMEVDVGDGADLATGM